MGWLQSFTTATTPKSTEHLTRPENRTRTLSLAMRMLWLYAQVSVMEAVDSGIHLLSDYQYLSDFPLRFVLCSSYPKRNAR